MRDEQDGDASSFTITFKERMCGVKTFALKMHFTDATKNIGPSIIFQGLPSKSGKGLL